RQLLAEAAWQARRRSPTVRAYFERAQRDDPQRKKIALVATAHYLIRVMHALLKQGTLWQERSSVELSCGSGEPSRNERGEAHLPEACVAGVSGIRRLRRDFERHGSDVQLQDEIDP